MKKIIFNTVIILMLSSCGDDFLDKEPVIGLTEDKLTDIQSMEALVFGAYATIRQFVHQPALYGAGMMRDILNRNREEYDPFFDHQISQNMTGWMYSSGYSSLQSLNTVVVSDMNTMNATDDQRDAIMGDVHFLRALIYFELNNQWTLPSTGYSVPLVLEPLSQEDRLETATSQAVKDQVESDIEAARRHFENVSGISNYMAATALAARIYFYHEKYNLAYERANEIIINGNFVIEPDVATAFEPQGGSKENIFTFKFNSVDGPGTSPSSRIWEAYQASAINGFYSMNPDGIAADLIMDADDARFNTFYTVTNEFIFVDGKYSTEQMDYRYIRLPEMYLTRAESNIMRNNNVTQQDVDDINTIKERADPSSVLTLIPPVSEMLNIIFEERTKELAFELGDHYLNTRRLQKPIIETGQEGGGTKSYDEYKGLLVFPFPQIEVDIHDLTRER